MFQIQAGQVPAFSCLKFLSKLIINYLTMKQYNNILIQSKQPKRCKMKQLKLMKKHTLLAAMALLTQVSICMAEPSYSVHNPTSPPPAECSSYSGYQLSNCESNKYLSSMANGGGMWCLYDDTGVVCYRRELRNGRNDVYKYHPRTTGATFEYGNPKTVTQDEDWFYIKMRAVDSAHLFLFTSLMDYPEYPYAHVKGSW